jgi:hypothetical protein
LQSLCDDEAMPEGTHQRIDDELWILIEPLLPASPPRQFRYPGRGRCRTDR